MTRRFRALVAHPHVEALGELAELLGGLGLVVETARTTVEALNKLRGQPPHVIVSHHVMTSSNPFDGVGLLEGSMTYAPDALRIALVATSEDAVELDYRPATSGMIIRLVAKAHERSRLVALVAEGLKLMNLVEDSRDLVRKLSLDQQKLQRRETLLDVVVKERTKELEETYDKLRSPPPARSSRRGDRGQGPLHQGTLLSGPGLLARPEGTATGARARRRFVLSFTTSARSGSAMP